MNSGILQRLIIILAALNFYVPTQGNAADAPVIFATDASATANPPATNVAAVVYGHIISLEDVRLKCLREYRSPVIEQMLQDYILDRECQRRGITASEREIDQRIAKLRIRLAPATLEDTLKKSHITMAEARDEIRRELEKPMLVAGKIKSLHMVHCRELVVNCGPSRSESTAFAMAADFRRQTLGGADFATMAEQHSEAVDKNKDGDMGVLYDRILNSVESPVLDAALALKQGEVSPPIKAGDGYHLVKAESTDKHHPPSEDALYADAAESARREQITFLVPQAISALIDHSKITFVDDDELVPGRPLPAAAATIDGHPIPMREVLDKCVAMYGPKVTDILVQNYLVDRECQKRGISVNESEIDGRVETLRKQCAPMTLEEGMKIHHTTMAGLRYDFRQDIERAQLATNRVQSTHMVHVRIILARANPISESDAERADRDARAQIIAIENQLKAGKDFEYLAAQYCVPDDPGKNGDMGVIFPAKPGMDSDIVNAAIAMKKGEISSQPVKTYSGYALLQAISDSDDHPQDEDAAYARALTEYRSVEAQRLIPQIIVGLIKKSNVTYYVHS